jgi:hypothetical protein
MSPRPFHAILPFLLITGIAAGQEKAEKPRKAPTPLKLQITLTRSQGEKKVTSAPYTLSFCADDRPARIRMGTKIPIQISKESPGQVSYQDVGNNIDCSAEALGDGRFKLICTFEQSFVYSPDARGTTEAAPGPVPLIRNFRTDVALFVHDGQAVQYTSAADPVSGETLRVDGTLSVVK